MERLVNTVQELSLARDLETVMRIVRKSARELTGADGATFILKDGGMCFYAEEDAISPLWKGSRFPLNTCISGIAMITKQAIVIENIYDDERIPLELYSPTFVKSLAMVPIRTIDPIGAIGNYWATQHIPTFTELKLLQALADITAVTLENINVYAELEQRVKDRTLQLELINKELDSFSYSISHDLRAPLRAINGYMSILVEDHENLFNDEGKRLANKVITGAKDMEQLINGLLEFSKMGKKELSKTNVSVKTLVSDLCKNLKEQNPDRAIEFIILDLPDIKADQTLLKQVFVNLLSNAVKYSGTRDKSVIEIGSEEKDGMSVVYYVKDNGTGFDMKYADKLFGVFQRLHSKTEFEGTGIGLAIVERIVSKHGGRIWADAKIGEGATFYFSLPK